MHIKVWEPSALEHRGQIEGGQTPGNSAWSLGRFVAWGNISNTYNPLSIIGDRTVSPSGWV